MRVNYYTKQKEMEELRKTIFNYEQRDTDNDMWIGFRGGSP